MAINGVSQLKMSGLATGLDTESIVEQMASLSKIRLNTEQQKFDELQWKQDSYRNVIDLITEFQNTYFNYLSPETNLSSTSLFGARSATSTDSGITVSASPNAEIGSFSTTVLQQASKAAVESGSNAVTNGIDLNFLEGTSGNEYTVSVTLDGSTKDVSFTIGEDAATTEANFLASINDSFSSADVSFKMNNGTLITEEKSGITHTGVNHKFTINPTTTNGTELKIIGLTDGASSTASTSTKLKDVNFDTDLQGTGFAFEINGESFTFSEDASISDVINTINDSDAGVKLSFNSLDNSFKLEAKDSGSGASIEVTQTSGNLLTAMFGTDASGIDIIGKGQSVSSAVLYENSITGSVAADGKGFGFVDSSAEDSPLIGVSGDASQFINQSVNVTVNGETKQITLWQYDSSGSKNDFTDYNDVLLEFNDELEREFGADAPTLSYDEDAKTFSLTGANEHDVIGVSALDGNVKSSALVTAFGFTDENATNELSMDTKLSDIFADITVGGTLEFKSTDLSVDNSITLDENTTLQDLVDGSGGYITVENGMVTVNGMSGATDEAQPLLASLFGENFNYPGVPPLPLTNTTSTFEGQNAIIEVDGVKITNNSNSFTVNGTTLDVTNAELNKASTVTTVQESETAFDAVKGFVEDYNTLIETLNNEITFTHGYDEDYPALTPEQKEEMSDEEIENWEEKAKQGLLYQDDTIQSFLTSLRVAVSGGTNITALNDMGITVSTSWQDNGKLEIDENKLKTALETNGDEIMEFFTDAETGFSAKVDKALDSAVSTSSVAKGSLIMLAGVDNSSTVNDNSISRQLESYQERIDELTERYEAEMERYWDAFTNLEVMTEQYASQSEWLTQQFGG